MDDMTKLADASVDEVKAALAGLSLTQLAALRVAELAGKNRSTALAAIDQAIADHAGDAPGAEVDAAAGGAVAASASAPDGGMTAATFDHSGPANITAATGFEPSGAPIQMTDIDASHPAVDANPRANTTVDQNRIDFNDPGLSGEDAVKRNLGIAG
ncbi:hypothetical protein ACVOMT_11650 [Sphingomonas panni]